MRISLEGAGGYAEPKKLSNVPYLYFRTSLRYNSPIVNGLLLGEIAYEE